MTSLLHHYPHHYPAITREDAESYVHEAGPWSRFLLTRWPVQSLIEGAVVLGVGTWAAIVLGLNHVWAGVAVFAVTVLVAALVAAPGAYTETHEEYASHYFAALRVHGGETRAHPYPGAAAGAVVGLAYALVRYRRALRSQQH